MDFEFKNFKYTIVIAARAEATTPSYVIIAKTAYTYLIALPSL
jgi:hypothetical protein